MVEILIIILLILVMVQIFPEFPRSIGKTLGKIKRDIINGYQEEAGQKNKKDNNK